MIFAKKMDPDTQNVGPDLKSNFIDTQIVISKYLDVSNVFFANVKTVLCLEGACGTLTP